LDNVNSKANCPSSELPEYTHDIDHQKLTILELNTARLGFKFVIISVSSSKNLYLSSKGILKYWKEYHQIQLVLLKMDAIPIFLNKLFILALSVHS